MKINQIFRLRSRQEGFSDTIFMTIIGGIIGSLFITGVFIWQEVIKQRDLMYLNGVINKAAYRSVEVIDKNISEEEKDINWFIYESINLGFSLEYPEYFILLDDNSGSSRSIDLVNYDINDPQYQRGNPNGIKIQIQFHEFSSNFTIDDLIETLEFEGLEEHSGATTKAAEEIQLGEYIEYAKYIVSGPGGPMMEYVAIDERHNLFYYILVFEPGYTNNKEFIEKILSSFSFLEEEKHVRFSDNIIISGYYTIFLEEYFDGKEYNCDAVTITSAPEEFVNNIVNLVDSGNTVHQKNKDGEPIVKLYLDNLSNEKKNSILNSTKDSPVDINIIQLAGLKGLNACGSVYQIIDVE